MSEKYPIPEQEDLCETFGQSHLNDRIYNDIVALISVLNDYDGPVAFEHALRRAYEEYDYSIDPDDERASKNHKNRIDRLGMWSPEAARRIVGRIPRKDIWIQMALTELDESEVVAENMHDVQQKCVEMSDIRAREYNQANAKDIQEQVLKDMDFAAGEYASIGEFVDAVIEQATIIASEEIPDRIESRKQGTKSSGGSVNEEIVRRALCNAGIDERDQLDKSKRGYFTGNTDDADLTIVHDSSQILRVEVKSSNLRERAGRAPGTGENWVLFGFFDDAHSLKQGIIEGNKQRQPLRDQVEAVYAPQSTVNDVDKQDRQQNEITFLRPISQFTNDMSEFISSGTFS